jgi:hypothetical protein
VVGDEHADAAQAQEADDALDLDDCDWVDAGKGLVEQDEAAISTRRRSPPDSAGAGES